MATQMFFRSLLAPYYALRTDVTSSMPVGTNRSANTVLTNYPNGTGGSLFYMTTTAATSAPTGPPTITGTSDGNATQQSGLMGTWVSLPLAAQSIAAQTWTFGGFFGESSTNYNAQAVISILIYRPSTASIVATIYDASTLLGTEFAVTPAGVTFTVSGSAVSTNDGDLVICQVWWAGTVGMSGTNFTCTLVFDGTTAVVNANTANKGSFLQSANTLTFSSTVDSFARYWLEVGAPTVSPGETRVSSDPGVGTIQDFGIAVAQLTKTQISTQTNLAGTCSGSGNDTYFTSFSIVLGAQTIAANQRWVLHHWNLAPGSGGPSPVLLIYRVGTGIILSKSGSNSTYPKSRATNAWRSSTHFDFTASQAVLAGDLLIIDLWGVNGSASEAQAFKIGGNLAEFGVLSGSGGIDSATASDYVSTLVTEQVLLPPSGSFPPFAGPLKMTPTFLKTITRRF